MSHRAILESPLQRQGHSCKFGRIFTLAFHCLFSLYILTVHSSSTLNFGFAGDLVQERRKREVEEIPKVNMGGIFAFF